MSISYDDLGHELLMRRETREAGFNYDDDLLIPRGSWCSSESAFQQAICAAVCDLTGLTQEAWRPLTQAEKIIWIEQAIAKERSKGATTQGEPQALTPPLPTVWFHGGQSYSKDGVIPIKVTNEEHSILKTFLDCDQAFDTKELSKSVSNPATVIGKLAEKFPETVKRPSHKGAGYSIRVRSKSK